MNDPTTPYDVADYLTTPERIAAFLELAIEEGGPSRIAQALGAVARAKGMAPLAREAGVTRGALSRALAVDGNPTLSTLSAVLSALGLRLRIDAKAA